MMAHLVQGVKASTMKNYCCESLGCLESILDRPEHFKTIFGTELMEALMDSLVKSKNQKTT